MRAGSLSASHLVMRLPKEALDELREILVGLGLGDLVDSAPEGELARLGSFLINLTAAALKTREKLSRVGIELPPSDFDESEPAPAQQQIPGLED